MKDIFSKRNIIILIILLLISLSFGCSKEEKTKFEIKEYVEKYGWNVNDIEISKSKDIFSIDSKNIFEKNIIDLSKEIGIDVNRYYGEEVFHVRVFLNDEISIYIDEEAHKVPLEATVWITKDNEIGFAVLRVAFLQVYYYPLDISIKEIESRMNDMYQKKESKNKGKVDEIKNPEVINGLPGENVREGDIYVFGEYKESLRWEVLNINDGKALLISEKAVEDIPNNNPEEWLKNSFYFEAFSIDDRYAKIDKNVFLLDEDQTLEYFPNQEVDEIMKKPALRIDLNKNINWDDSLSWDHQLEFFMYYLMDKDIDSIFDLIGLRGSHLERFENVHGKEQDIYEAYGFLKDVEIKGYQVLSSEERQYDGRRYIVELDIGESQTPYFTKGKSNWQIELGIDGSSIIQLFKPEEVQINPIQFSETSQPVKFAYKAAVYLEVFEDIDNFNDIVPGKDIKEHYFDQFTFNMMRLLYNRFEDEFITAEGLKEEVEKTFGITDVDFTRYYRYDPETDSMSFGASGGTWMFTDLISEEFEEDTGTYIITIDFYADGAYMLKAKTMKYKVVEIEDDEYRMISSECLYDSGYIPYRDGI